MRRKILDVISNYISLRDQKPRAGISSGGQTAPLSLLLACGTIMVLEVKTQEMGMYKEMKKTIFHSTTFTHEPLVSQTTIILGITNV
jgi:hypothetical protein